MGRNMIETLMGAVVLLVAGIFVYISYQSGNISAASGSGYTISANFQQTGGVSVGSDVRISGIKVGSVVEQTLDRETYLAKLVLNIKENIELPRDSSAAIVSESLLGGRYIEIVPGADQALLQNGEELQYTQDAVNIEQLIGKFAFGSAESDTPADQNADSTQESNSVPSL